MTQRSKQNAAKNQGIAALALRLDTPHQALGFAALFVSFRELLAELKEENALPTLPRTNRPLPNISDDADTKLLKNQSCH